MTYGNEKQYTIQHSLSWFSLNLCEISVFKNDFKYKSVLDTKAPLSSTPKVFQAALSVCISQLAYT